MGPTVIHGKAIVGGDGSGWSQLDRWDSCQQQFGSSNCGSIGTVKTSLTGHEFVEAFLIFGSEVSNEFTNGFVGGGVHTPHITSHVDDSHQFEQNDGEVNEGPIGNGIATDGHNVLNLAETFPQGFNGLVGGPQGCNAGLIGF